MEVPSEEPIGRCRECNYSLQGLHGSVCPECGTRFDGANPKTTNTGRPVGPIVRLFLQSHEWKLSLLAFGGAIAGIWGATVPFGDWDAYVISCMIWIATYVLWLGLLLMRRLVVSLTAQPHPDTPIGAKVIIPCLFVVMVLLILTDVPCRVAFWASRDAMEKVVQESLRGEGISKPKSAGLYVVVGTKRVPGGVKLCIARARQDNTRTGFFRKLDASAPLSEIAEYKHYGGSWYLCEY